MRLEFDPMTKPRAACVAKVNAHFAALELAAAHKERVYIRKREIAWNIMEGVRLADDHPFVEEARLRGLPQEEFARDVINKPDVSSAADGRELHRQRILLRLAAAKAPDELQQVLNEMGIR